MAKLFFERPDAGERAVVVHVDFSTEDQREELAEFELLVDSAGVEIVGVVTGRRDQPHIKTFVGSGKLDEVESVVQGAEAEVVLFNHALSPSQQRNLEQRLKCRVIDRTGVILDIFAQRARTHEGKLQVELAQLTHLSTRLVRGWTHLERQKGGIGLRGPGETQLESDRRMVRTRIQSVQRQLEKVRRQRAVGRKSRQKSQFPLVSFVGYTNAGKSTLFNRISDADVYAQDQLFATLDTTLRQVVLPGLGKVIVADTVGFIRHLPHQLVDAFKATLEETVEADLLLHVIDYANEDWRSAAEQVDYVLEEIGAHEKPVLLVFNKIDGTATPPRVQRSADGVPEAVWLSAKTGAGVDDLLSAMSERLSSRIVKGVLSLDYQHADVRAYLFEANLVECDDGSDESGYRLGVRMPADHLEQLMLRYQLDSKSFELESASLDESGASSC